MTETARISWEYATIRLSAGRSLAIESPDNSEIAPALEAGQCGYLGSINYLGSHGWKLLEGTCVAVDLEKTPLTIFFYRETQTGASYAFQARTLS